MKSSLLKKKKKNMHNNRRLPTSDDYYIYALPAQTHLKTSAKRVRMRPVNGTNRIRCRRRSTNYVVTQLKNDGNHPTAENLI